LTREELSVKGQGYARRDLRGAGNFDLCMRLRLRRALRSDVTMSIDYILGGIVTVVIMVYLVYALIRPERF
jgi:K+-transporting ATPase KdpF subunit